MKTPTEAELSEQMTFLQKHLFGAKAHFDIFMGVKESWAKYIDVINSSAAFWNLTIQAHSGMSVLYLCRIYDQHDRAIHLFRFLNDIKKCTHFFNETAFKERLKNEKGRDIEGLAKYPRDLNEKRLAEDIEFCTTTNPLVKNLVKWRNNMVVHFNYEEAIFEKKPFHEKNPLPFEDIETLISRGFDIVNRYSALFRAQQYSENFLSYQKGDYAFVLEHLKRYFDRDMIDSMPNPVLQERQRRRR